MKTKQSTKNFIEPSKILNVLQSEGTPLTATQISEKLNLVKSRYSALKNMLVALEKEGQLACNHRGAYLIPHFRRADLVAGQVLGRTEGHGFLLRDDGGADLYLPSHEMAQVFHGDRVLAQPGATDAKGRCEGRIIEIISRAHTSIVGRIKTSHGVMFLQPEDKRIPHEILLDQHSLPAKKERPALDGQIATIELIRYPSPGQLALGRLLEVLDSSSEEDLLVEIAVRKHHLPYEFSASCLTEANHLPDEVQASDHQGRKDLRDLAFVTIDGEDAKDFDDALYCEPASFGHRLWVAIADVSHYVTPGSELDKEAKQRGTSVYFPQRVIPMLPEKLSNGLCSLNPHVDRLALVCQMDIDREGIVTHWQFYPALFRSSARLTYTKVAADIAEGKLPRHLDALFAAYRALHKARVNRGAIDLETIETHLTFNSKREVENIEPVHRNVAHRLVEECMLAANTSAASWLSEEGCKLLYRIHEPAALEKVERLRDFLKSLGLQLGGGDKPTPKDYARLSDETRARADGPVIHTMLLRSMQQARYSPDNVGHFGLAYEAYTHFTSPIRRYPDLMIHRALYDLINKREQPLLPLVQLGQQASLAERRATEATREVDNKLRCLYMRRHVGSVFAGTISAVTNFGVFITLRDLLVDGLVHISDLGEDYFHYHEARQELVGERTSQIFRLGQPLNVRLVRADVDAGRIDFALQNSQAGIGRGKKHARK